MNTINQNLLRILDINSNSETISESLERIIDISKNNDSADTDMINKIQEIGEGINKLIGIEKEEMRLNNMARFKKPDFKAPTIDNINTDNRFANKAIEGSSFSDTEKASLKAAFENVLRTGDVNNLDEIQKNQMEQVFSERKHAISSKIKDKKDLEQELENTTKVLQANIDFKNANK